MPRFIPPHLMVLVTLLIIVGWVMLVRHFRHNAAMQTFVAETFGDDSPKNALRNFELAKLRLTDHLNDSHLDDQLRRQIELALGIPVNDELVSSHGTIVPFDEA